MVFPPPISHEADAGGLGRAALSICAEPSIAINPSVIQPTAKTANTFLMFIPLKLCPSIEPDLPGQRNLHFSPSYETAEPKTRFSPNLFPILRNPQKGNKPDQ